jgi:hypothetical protein
MKIVVKYASWILKMRQDIEPILSPVATSIMKNAGDFICKTRSKKMGKLVS